MMGDAADEIYAKAENEQHEPSAYEQEKFESEQLDFFDLEENLPSSDHVGPSPEATIKAAFLRFHADNPHIYDELVMLTRRAQRAGATKIGIGMLFEVLRWRVTLRTGGDDFKLNNNYRSYYARMIMMRNEDLLGIFEIRRLHGPGLKWED